MALICVSSRTLTVSFVDSFYVFSFDESKHIDVQGSVEKLSNLQLQEKHDGGILLVASAYSPDERYFAFCHSKYLSVWETDKWTLLNKRPLARAASKVRFSPSGDTVVVADKSGDVYLYGTNDDEPGVLTLGHLSLLLDVLLTRDEKFVITCDRDEKIRVSNYPNGYNIHSYCLGHNAFVSCIEFLPHSPDHLLSASGDGTLKIWRYKDGHEMFSYQLGADVKTDSNQSPPVVCLATMDISKSESLVCVILADVKSILVYSVEGDGMFTLTLLQNVGLASEPLSFYIKENILWLLSKSDSGVSSFVFDKSERKLNSSSMADPLQAIFSQHLSHKLKTVDKHSSDYFHKKSFNEVQCYYKRKLDRIECSKKLKNV